MREVGLALISTIITVLIIPIGIIHNIGNSIRECYKLGLMEGILKLIYYWIEIFIQFGVVVKYLFLRVFRMSKYRKELNVVRHLSLVFAKANDYLWNVFSGELLEWAITTREDTLFGNGGVTVSQAIGKEELEGFTTSFGKDKLSKTLNWFFGEDAHCIDAYKKYMKLLR